VPGYSALSASSMPRPMMLRYAAFSRMGKPSAAAALCRLSVICSTESTRVPSQSKIATLIFILFLSLSHRVENFLMHGVTLLQDIIAQRDVECGKRLFQLDCVASTDDGGGDEVEMHAPGHCQRGRCHP